MATNEADIDMIIKSNYLIMQDGSAIKKAITALSVMFEDYIKIADARYDILLATLKKVEQK